MASERAVVPAAPPPHEPPTVVATPRAADDSDGGAFYTRAWFWIGVGALVAGTATAFILLSADRDPTHGGLGFQDWRMR